MTSGLHIELMFDSVRCASKAITDSVTPHSRNGHETMGQHRSTEQVRRHAYKARLYPSKSQEITLDGQGHAARAVWNLLHEWYTCREGGIAKRPPIAELDRLLRDARTKPLPDWEWLNDLPAQAMQQILKHYLRAWDRYSRRVVGGPPNFKQRSFKMAVDVPQAAKLNIKRLNRRWGRVQIPLVGQVRFRWTRPLPGVSRDHPGRITGARLVKDSLGWQICFRIEEPAAAATSNPGHPVGIDRGVVHTLTLSNGRTLDMPSLLTTGEQRRLLGLERKAARQQLARKRSSDQSELKPMSRRHHQIRVQIAALRAREARRRQDWLHKSTTDLAKSHGLIVVEDLRVATMTRSAHRTIQQPGRNVRAKAGLNRSILGMAWGRAERMLTYKCPLFGGTLVKVDPRNSSIECARCGNVARENRVSQAVFRCLACGHVANADTNAAQVVLKRGLTARSGAAPGCGGTAREARATVPHRELFSLR
jgi:putative transposase